MLNSVQNMFKFLAKREKSECSKTRMQKMFSFCSFCSLEHFLSIRSSEQCSEYAQKLGVHHKKSENPFGWGLFKAFSWILTQIPSEGGVVSPPTWRGGDLEFSLSFSSPFPRPSLSDPSLLVLPSLSNHSLLVIPSLSNPSLLVLPLSFPLLLSPTHFCTHSFFSFLICHH